MSLGLEMIRCCIKEYAHFKAADVGVSVLAFLESLAGGAASIDWLTSITKRTASLAALYICYTLSNQGGGPSCLTPYRLINLFLFLVVLPIAAMLPSVLLPHGLLTKIYVQVLYAEEHFVPFDHTAVLSTIRSEISFLAGTNTASNYFRLVVLGKREKVS